MTNFSAARQYTYLNGALIDPFENNANEDEIYNQFNASINAITGHTHSGSVGDGPKLGPASLDLTASYTWSGVHFHTTNMALSTLAKMYFDGGTNTYIYAASVNDLRIAIAGTDVFKFVPGISGVLVGDFFIPSGNKLFLDGANDTYISETAPGTINITLDAIDRVQITATSISFVGEDVIMSPTKKLYLNQPGNTWLAETSAGIFDIFLNGAVAPVFKINKAGAFAQFNDLAVVLNSTFRLYYDGMGDTFTAETAPNVLETFVGDAVNSKLRITTTATTTRNDIRPIADGTLDLGFSVLGFRDLFTTNIKPSLAAAGAGFIGVTSPLQLPAGNATTATRCAVGRSVVTASIRVSSAGASLTAHNATVVRNSLGNYTVTFTNPYLTANSAIITVTPHFIGTAVSFGVANIDPTTTTTTCTVYTGTVNDGGGGGGVAQADVEFSLHAVGSQ